MVNHRYRLNEVPPPVALHTLSFTARDVLLKLLANKSMHLFNLVRCHALARLIPILPYQEYERTKPQAAF